jgi:hypothetical protein
MYQRLGASLTALAWAAGVVYLAAYTGQSSQIICVDFPRGVGESSCRETASSWDWNSTLTLATVGAVLTLLALYFLWCKSVRVAMAAFALALVGLVPVTWSEFVVPVGEHFGL